jgi:hypothetical protein
MTLASFFTELIDLPESCRQARALRDFTFEAFGVPESHQRRAEAGTIRSSLEETRAALRQVRQRRDAEQQQAFTVEWGKPSSTQASSEKVLEIKPKAPAADPPEPKLNDPVPPITAPVAAPPVPVQVEAPQAVLHESIGPTVRSLIDLLDGIERAISDPLVTPERGLQSASLRTRKILESLSVERIEQLETLNPEFQEVLDWMPAPSAELGGCVASSIRPGYRWGRGLLRPQQVVGFRWDGLATVESSEDSLA